MIYKFNFIERILLGYDVIPHPLMDIASNVGLAKALGVAVKLNITDQLSSSPRTPAQIAQQSGVSEKGVEIILNCLQAMGYAQQQADGYAFTSRGTKFLAKDSPDSFRYFILFCDWAYSTFLNLEETILKGEQPRTNLDYFDDHLWELFSRAMTELARTNLKEVTAKIKLPASATNLMDLGGSHGLYSIDLCKKYPSLAATIIDFEPVRKYADESIQAHSIQDRVTFQAADFMKEALPAEQDVALLFQIIHGNTIDANRDLFSRIYASLRPKGQLIVLEQVKGVGGKSQLSRATTSFMALNLFHQSNGNTYTFEEVKAWAMEAGFKKAQLKPLNSPGFALICCEK